MLFVFDLDFTLWDCGGTWCDCTTPPYRKKKEHIFDSVGRHIRLYDDVRAVLDTLIKKGHRIAAASRTHEPEWANELLELLGINGLFDYKEIYPGPKIPHFKTLKNKSSLEFQDMVFFDDEYRNIEDVSGLGVKAIHVPDGIRFSDVYGLI